MLILPDYGYGDTKNGRNKLKFYLNDSNTFMKPEFTEISSIILIKRFVNQVKT